MHYAALHLHAVEIAFRRIAAGADPADAIHAAALKHGLKRLEVEALNLHRKAVACHAARIRTAGLH